MANIANPLPYITKRECGILPDVKAKLFDNRLNAAKNLYRKDLTCHFGCVNAIEFSNNGEILVSGGDDRRVMVWRFGQAILDRGKPEQMKTIHQSNIFCLGITDDQQKIYSGGNDDVVLVHDLESKRPLEVLSHQRAVCCLSIDPYNDRVVTTAGNDGRLLLFDTRQSVHESLVISRSRKAFHGVMFHPLQQGILVSANARDGVALWDLKAPKHPVIRYSGNHGTGQNCMNVRFNSAGTHILALRRRLAPVMYAVHSAEPVAEFYHQDYYNSCTMKSCSFAGEGDRYVLSGSDDFNLYLWKVPEAGNVDMVMETPHIVLYGHRSIVNQVRFNPQYSLIASSGVEKIIKLWSTMEYPGMRGALLEEAAGADNPREIYSHEDYMTLMVNNSGPMPLWSTMEYPGMRGALLEEAAGADNPREIYSHEDYMTLMVNNSGPMPFMSHSYAEQSTSEDPCMMAFFDSLVQRELECLAEESDSCDNSSETLLQPSSSSDEEHILSDFLPLVLPPKRAQSHRSQRCPNRLARSVPSRYPKNSRSQKRGSVRRPKHMDRRMLLSKFKLIPAGRASTKGARSRSAGRVRRARGTGPATARRDLPSSGRSDSDEPVRPLYRPEGRIIRPLRRRMNLSRAAKRKSKTASTSYRKTVMNLRSNAMAQDSDNATTFSNVDDNFEANMSLPSTSTGYRGQTTTALFRITEVDSDDDQSVGSRPISPRSQNQNIPNNLVSIIPTPVNGSQDLGDSMDSMGDSLIVEPPESDSTPPRERRARRARRNGRILQRSDSSESPLPNPTTSMTIVDRLTPEQTYNVTARLRNETNESELDTSSSEGSVKTKHTRASLGLDNPDTGLGTVVTYHPTSTRRSQPSPDVSDDEDWQTVTFRQRVKKARRNYRTHMDSDSN